MSSPSGQFHLIFKAFVLTEKQQLVSVSKKKTVEKNDNNNNRLMKRVKKEKDALRGLNPGTVL